MISTKNAEHYLWGGNCDSWNLLKRDDMSIKQERVPPGGAEVMHYHERARQFFYILEGEGLMVFADHQVSLQKGEGIEIAPQIQHQFRNASDADVHFLVISVPATGSDRINLS